MPTLTSVAHLLFALELAGHCFECHSWGSLFGFSSAGIT